MQSARRLRRPLSGVPLGCSACGRHVAIINIAQIGRRRGAIDSNSHVKGLVVSGRRPARPVRRKPQRCIAGAFSSKLRRTWRRNEEMNNKLEREWLASRVAAHMFVAVVVLCVLGEAGARRSVYVSLTWMVALWSGLLDEGREIRPLLDAERADVAHGGRKPWKRFER